MMKSYTFKKIDAFTSGNSCGNPAGAVYLEPGEEITDCEMQRIARELKGYVSEVAYASPGRPEDGSDAQFRYFSCEQEVEFCGHATIAVMYDLIANSGGYGSRTSLMIRTNKGLLEVKNRIPEEDAVYIAAPAPEFVGPGIDPDELASAMNFSRLLIASSSPLPVVNAGLNTLLVPVTSADACIGAEPDYNDLRNFCLKNGIEIVTVYSGKTVYEKNSFRTRVFAPVFGYLEDPATGSGNAALGYHLLRRGEWSGGPVLIEQGRDREFPNIVRLLSGGSGADRRVMFGGRAAVKIAGRYLLP